MSQIRCMQCMSPYDEQYDICPYCGYKRGMEPTNPLYLPEGTLLDGKYLIGAAIGHGGFGITYVAFDQLIEKRVAIKEYFPANLSTRTVGNPTIYPFTTQDADNNYRYGRDKFIEEARTLAKFSNMDSIVSVLTCFTQNNTAYIVMEYLDGEDLLEHIKKHGGKIGWEETLRLLSPVMDALTALHGQGLIHRDISPDNIFVTKNGKTKLLDFGTARFAMGEKSKSLSVILKPGYAPPEQYSSRGKQGPWTDVYALAATVYRCVTGQAPVDAVDRQMGTALESPSSFGVRIPKSAEDTLMLALALEPERRHQSVSKFKEIIYSKLGNTSAAINRPVVDKVVAEPVRLPDMDASIQADDNAEDAVHKEKGRGIRTASTVIAAILLIMTAIFGIYLNRSIPVTSILVVTCLTVISAAVALTGAIYAKKNHVAGSILSIVAGLVISITVAVILFWW